MRRVLIPLLFAAVLLAGCRTSSEAPGPAGSPASDAPTRQDSGEREAVLTALRNIKQDALRNAFADLSRYHYTRYTRTEQFDDAFRRTAFTERVTRVERTGPRRAPVVLQADTAGTFDAGLPGRFVDVDPDAAGAVALPRYVLPDDPPYLAPRNRDAFFYRMLPDTAFLGAPTQVFEITARPGEGDAQSLRQTRFYVDRGSNQLIAVALSRVEASLFYDEESRLYFRLRRAPDAGWVPYQARVVTRLRLPFQAAQQARTTSVYYRYAPAGT